MSWLLNMSKHEGNVGADCLAHVFWGVLDDSYRRFSNPISPEAARARYMDLESVRLPGTRLVHIAEKLACKYPLIDVSVAIQWLGRGATEASGYQSVGPVIKYQGGWQPSSGYLPYMPKNQSKYGRHLFGMPKNEVHGRVWQIQKEAPGVQPRHHNFTSVYLDVSNGCPQYTKLCGGGALHTSQVGCICSAQFEFR